jgi:hypothetical protein
MIWVLRATVEWYWQGKTEELGKKPVPVPLCPPQIPRGFTRARTRASAVRGRLLTTWAMSRLEIEVTSSSFNISLLVLWPPPFILCSLPHEPHFRCCQCRFGFWFYCPSFAATYFTWSQTNSLKHGLSYKVLCCSELSSGIYCCVKWLSTDVSEVRTWNLSTKYSRQTRRWSPQGMRGMW